MINVLLQWLISILLVLGDGFGYRLQRLEQLGGPIRAVVINGITSLNAEGDSIVGVPLLGPDAYRVTQRLTLPYGPILDLYHTDQALYALTDSHLIRLSADGQRLQQVIRGGGERLSGSIYRLVVTHQEAGVRTYTILPDGSLSRGLQIPTPTETQQAVLIDNSLLALADRAAGVRLIRLTATDSQVSASLPQVAPSTGIANFSHWLYISSQHRIYIVETAINPRVIGYYAPLRDTQGLAWLDNWLLVADGVDGLKVYGLDPTIHYRNSLLSTPAYHIAANNQAIVTAHPSGLSIYEPNDLPQLVMRRFVPLWDTPHGLSLNANIALVALGTGGLGIINVENGQVLNSLTFPNSNVQHVVAHPNYPNLLYLALSDGRLVSLYIGQQSLITSDLPIAGTPTYLAIQNNILALASGRAGLQFFALNPDPTQPQLIGTLPPSNLDTNGVQYVQAASMQRWLVSDGDNLLWVQLDQRTPHILSVLPNLNGYPLLTPDGRLVVGYENHLTSYQQENDLFVAHNYYNAPRAYTDMQALLGQLVVATENAGVVVLEVQNAALPREQRWIDYPTRRLTIQGDDLILLGGNGGWQHWRFPLLLADRPAIEPLLVGSYQPTLGIRRLLPVSAQSALDGVVVNGVPVLLDSNGIPYRPDSHTTNPSIVAVALASNSSQLWAIGHDGRLWELDPQTLEALSSAIQLNLPVSSMVSHHEALWLGTRSGEVWQVILANHHLQRHRSNLGGAVLDLKPVDDGTWLVSADTGGLWWLGSDFETLAHTPTHAFAADFDPSGQWLGLATGACGLHILDTHLSLQAYLYGQVVTDIRFEGSQLVAVVNGIPTRYQFDPTRPAPPPPQPRRLNDTEWESNPCLALHYEIWVDGALVAVTNQTHWEPPQNRDYRWQVVAIDPLGNHSRSPEWTSYAPITGWIGAPPLMATSLAPPSNNDPTPPWWALGLVLVAIGLSGLWTLIHRR